MSIGLEQFMKRNLTVYRALHLATHKVAEPPRRAAATWQVSRYRRESGAGEDSERSRQDSSFLLADSPVPISVQMTNFPQTLPRPAMRNQGFFVDWRQVREHKLTKEFLLSLVPRHISLTLRYYRVGPKDSAPGKGIEALATELAI